MIWFFYHSHRKKNINRKQSSSFLSKVWWNFLKHLYKKIHTVNILLYLFLSCTTSVGGMMNTIRNERERNKVKFIAFSCLVYYINVRLIFKVHMCILLSLNLSENLGVTGLWENMSTDEGEKREVMMIKHRLHKKSCFCARIIAALTQFSQSSRYKEEA